MIAIALSPDTLQAVPKLSWVIYKVIKSPAKAPSGSIPTIDRNGTADIIAPPGAPGAAIITTASVSINGIIIPKFISRLFINKTLVTQEVIVIILPAKWMFAHRGITNSLIWGEVLFFLAQSKFIGIVAAEDCVPIAVKYAGIWFFKSFKGFFYQ